jgi:hypothetical protein
VGNGAVKTLEQDRMQDMEDPRTVALASDLGNKWLGISLDRLAGSRLTMTCGHGDIFCLNSTKTGKAFEESCAGITTIRSGFLKSHTYFSKENLLLVGISHVGPPGGQPGTICPALGEQHWYTWGLIRGEVCPSCTGVNCGEQGWGG